MRTCSVTIAGIREWRTPPPLPLWMFTSDEWPAAERAPMLPQPPVPAPAPTPGSDLENFARRHMSAVEAARFLFLISAAHDKPVEPAGGEIIWQQLHVFIERDLPGGTARRYLETLRRRQRNSQPLLRR